MRSSVDTNFTQLRRHAHQLQIPLPKNPPAQHFPNTPARRSPFQPLLSCLPAFLPSCLPAFLPSPRLSHARAARARTRETRVTTRTCAAVSVKSVLSALCPPFPPTILVTGWWCRPRALPSLWPDVVVVVCFLVGVTWWRVPCLRLVAVWVFTSAANHAGAWVAGSAREVPRLRHPEATLT